MSKLLTIGLHCNHDASVTICKGDNVLCTIAEERVTGIKHYAGFPYNSLIKALEYTKLKGEKADVIAFSSEKLFFPQHQNSYIISLNRKKKPVTTEQRNLKKKEIEQGISYPYLLKDKYGKRHWSKYYEELKKLGIIDDKTIIYSISHHLGHASAAFRLSEVKDACVLTLDGVGDGISGTIYKGDNNTNLDIIKKSISKDSLGGFFQAGTETLGFVPADGEHKTMGLAGLLVQNDIVNPLADKICTEDGVLQSETKWKWREYTWNNKVTKIDNPIGAVYPPTWMKELYNSSTPEHFAFLIQDITQKVMLEYVKTAMDLTSSKNICCAGGVFLNVKANLLIAETLGPEYFFVYPDSVDSGLSIGAALEAISQETNNLTTKPKWNVYSGNEFSDSDIRKFIETLDKEQLKISLASFELLAQEILGGKIIGTFQGRLESGPRALGNRSILADPRSNLVKERVRKLKRSEHFVPYAPSVMDSEVSKLWKSNLDCKYMTFAVRASDYAKVTVPAIVHNDGTMRPQVVSAASNEWLYKLLIQFKKISGVGVLLNTSFNSHGKPIVGSPIDAIEYLKDGYIDGLSIGKFYIKLKIEHKTNL